MEEEGDCMSNLYDTCSQHNEDVSTTHMPKDGMKFDLEQAAFDFYKAHAREISFGI